MADQVLSIKADFSAAGFTIGSLNALLATVKTKKYISNVLKMTHSKMAESFDDDADLARVAAKSRFHHVYEWNTPGGKGLAGGRLWRHTLTGAGSDRTAGFRFIASRKPIPSPEERAKDSNDPMSLVPQENIDRLSKRKYFFYWKAPIMEYNTPVNIVPRYAQALFIPTGNPARPFVFASKQIRATTPGGSGTTGAFSAFWSDWWNTAAPGVFEDKVKHIIENDIAGIPIAQRSRVKNMSVGVNSDFHKEMVKGERVAERYMENKSAGYSEAARYVDSHDD